MSNNLNLYCKVFINTQLDEASLVKIIAQLINGKISQINSISSDYLDLDVISNKEFDEKYINLPIDGFLFYKYFLDVEPMPGIKYDDYISQLKILIKGLREKGFNVVPACAFENELNEGKNYKEFMK